METGKENPYSCVVLAGMRNQVSFRRHLLGRLDRMSAGPTWSPSRRATCAS